MAKDKKAIKKSQSYEKFASARKQRVITWCAFLIVAALCVLSSFLSLAMDFENADWNKIITNLCLSLSITIIAMILAIKDGELGIESKTKGEYAETKVNFGEALKLVVDREVFRQYCDILYTKEKKSYVTTALESVEVYNENYLKVSDETLKALLKEPKMCMVGIDAEGNEITKPLDQLSKEQYDMLKTYRSGKFKFEKLPFTFFTSRSSTNDYKRYAAQQDKQKFSKLLGIIYKCLIVFLITIIFAVTGVGENNSTPVQIVYDTISRILTLLSAMFFGYGVAYDEMKENINSLQYKIDVINQFSLELHTGSFKPKDIDEVVLDKISVIEEKRAKEEEERKRKEQEAIDSVVDVEVIPPKDDVLEIEMTEEEIRNYTK